MKRRRVLNLILLLLCINCPLLVNIIENVELSICLPVAMFLCIYTYLFWIPFYQKDIPVRLQIMMGGHDLACVCLEAGLMQIIMTIFIFQYGKAAMEWYYFLTALAFLSIWILWLNAIFRMIVTSKQAKLFHKLAVVFLWWVPFFSIYWIYQLIHSVQSEFYIESTKWKLDRVRAENQICQTKYPIVMVHGVFFRDWQLFQYWGRIPEALIRNGANIFYGRQQSAAPVSESAQELKEQILKIIEEQHCGKVNIIAHSKGGLDTRYAISRLGLAPYVASLTTINTPHRGCLWAEKILQSVPDGLLQLVAKRYEKLFTILGDKKPDFVSAVKDLTSSRCMQLNQIAQNQPSVFYQSSISIMRKNRSDGFPLNFSHFYVKRVEGENDGLVSVPSASWGYDLGVMQADGVRGISHGDMIDLRRENIRGFDVREFYVKLVMDLKRRGF